MAWSSLSSHLFPKLTKLSSAHWGLLSQSASYKNLPPSIRLNELPNGTETFQLNVPDTEEGITIINLINEYIVKCLTFVRRGLGRWPKRRKSTWGDISLHSPLHVPTPLLHSSMVDVANKSSSHKPKFMPLCSLTSLIQQKTTITTTMMMMRMMMKRRSGSRMTLPSHVLTICRSHALIIIIMN